MYNPENLFSLKGKTALITGATGHLGRAIAYIFAESGAHVILNARCREQVSELVGQMNALGLSAEGAVCDIRSQIEIRDFAHSLSQNPLNVLVNNAYSGGAGTIETCDEEQYLLAHEATTLAAHRMLVSLLPNIRRAVMQAKDASIINIASMYGIVSPNQRIYDNPIDANPPFYGAAKAALIQWTRYAACEFARESIRINCISPGPFPRREVVAKREKLISELKSRIPMGRVAAADEIKGPALFLASSASTFVTGANIVVDGGWSCW